MNTISQLIEQALLNVHTTFIGKVISISGNTATVQPLDMIVPVGGSALKRAVIANCPIAESARYRLNESEIEVCTNVDFASQSCTKETIKTVEVTPIAEGDIVVCVCGERDISQSRKGITAAPARGHHEIKDAIIIAIL